MSKNNSLRARVTQSMVERRQRILDGKVNCIPWGLPRFETQSPGIEQKKYYLFTANSKVGKTQITDYLCMLSPIKRVVENKINVKLKLFYFSLEMTKEEKMLSAMAYFLYELSGGKIRVSPKDLMSTRKEKVLDKDILAEIDKYSKYLDKLEECVTFIDDIRHPTGINIFMEKYAKLNGKSHMKTVVWKGKNGEEDEEKEIFDYYEPDDPDEYVMIIVDHISLISPEKGKSKQKSMDDFSSQMLIKLRNKYSYIPIVVQQQSAAQESVENAKANKLKPSLDGLGDCKLTGRDANLILGLFSPFRHEIPKYLGYDIKFFRDNIRFLEILGGREGGAGSIAPLFFDGAVNKFAELPSPDNLSKVESLIKRIRDVK